MTPRLALTIAGEHYIARLRASPRGVVTSVILGGYLAGVAATAGGLLLAGIKIGRKTA